MGFRAKVLLVALAGMNRAWHSGDHYWDYHSGALYLNQVTAIHFEGIVRRKHMTEYQVNSSSPGQNGRLFTDDSFKCIFLNEKFRILIEISLKCIPKGQIDNNPALV